MLTVLLFVLVCVLCTLYSVAVVRIIKLNKQNQHLKAHAESWERQFRNEYQDHNMTRTKFKNYRNEVFNLTKEANNCDW